MGTVKVLHSEVVNYYPLSTNDAIKSRFIKQNQFKDLENLLTKKEKPKFLIEEDSDSEETSNDPLELPNGLEDEHIPWKLDVNSFILRISNSVELFDDCRDEKFQNSLSRLSQKTCIGFDLIGNISRYGAIQLFIFSSDDGNYAFKATPEIASSLKPIIESESILKIIFDTRLISDALYGLFKLKLTNVHDITVWETLIHQKNHRRQMLPVKFITLDQCLFKYLKIRMPKKPEKIFESKILLENLIRQRTLLLRELRTIQINEYLRDINDTTKLFLSCYKNANEHEMLGLEHLDQDVSHYFHQKDLIYTSEFIDLEPLISMKNMKEGFKRKLVCTHNIR